MAFQRSSGKRTTGDLPDLLRRYVRQETVEPLRSAGRFLTYGLAGAATLGLGTVLLTVGGLRALQTWSVPMDAGRGCPIWRPVRQWRHSEPWPCHG